jgi:uncharacterized membrane protein
MIGLWFVFPAIFLTFFLLRLVAWGRWGASGCGWGPAYYGAYGRNAPPMDPKESLRQRLARGDITVDEYEKLAATIAK